jgi:hypothetical protein
LQNLRSCNLFVVIFLLCRNHLKDLRPKQLEEYEAAFGGGSKGASNVRRQPKSKPASNGAGKKKNKNKQSGDDSNQARGDGRDKAGARQGGGDGGDISVMAQPTGDGQRLTISNAAGDGRDININISMQASPVKQRGGGGIEMSAEVEGEGDDNPFTW